MFESAEHQSFYPLELPGLPADKQTFTVSDGIQLGFGDVCALGGDYFAVAQEPISFGYDEEDRKNRFLNAYETLIYSKKHKLNNIIAIIEEQARAIDKAMSQGKSEYEGISQHKFKEMLKAIVYTKFEIIDILAMGFDHMGENATIAHQVGHSLALEAAARAHYITDPWEQYQQLEYAYSLEAFACHFLIDHFASGHLRTPSMALYEKFGARLGTLLSLFMHSEENNMGLYVKNEQGDLWKAYGDAHLFEDYNHQTKDIATAALQTVINEVYHAFQSGQVPKNTNSAAYTLFPMQVVDNNYSPLFLEDKANNQLFYRAHLDDLDCQEYKKLKHSKVPHILAHFFKRYIKEKLTTEKEISTDSSFNEDDSQGMVNNKFARTLKHFFFFKDGSDKGQRSYEDVRSERQYPQYNHR